MTASTAQQSAQPGQAPRRLVDHIGPTLIVAHREDTTPLETALTQAGCRVTVLRQVHRPEYQDYARSYLCLLNHQQAWERAEQSAHPTLIVEADFVPVVNFGRLPVSFDPEDTDLGIAWLYTCAPQAYAITANGYAVGYSTAMVAYVITARSAAVLRQRAQEVTTDPGPYRYSPWDSGLAYYLQDRGFRNYVPFRNYGEHGGLPNPEHFQNRLSRTHRADVLYGPLSFRPSYACDTPSGQARFWRCWQGRGYGRGKGIARLLLGKYVRLPVLTSAQRPLPLASFALRRQLTLTL